MFDGKKILALVGARSGSKGLPKKNILDFHGKPLIAWSIEAGLKSQYVDCTIVSTDSEEISQIAKKFGAEVPFLRPAPLADDTSSIEDVIAHAVDDLQKKGRHFDFVVLLQPTSPLRTASHLDAAIEKYFHDKKGADDTLVSVFKAPSKSAWLMHEMSNGYIEFALPQITSGNRRQEIPSFYFPNGAIYIAPLTQRPLKFYTKHTLHFEMSASESVDIDTHDDFELALKNKTK